MATKKRSSRKAVTKKAVASAEHFIQFSKRMTIYVLVFWGVYRIAQLVALVMEPDAAEALSKLVSGVDTMAIFFGGFYTTNSISEKGFRMYRDVQKYVYTGTSDDDEEKDKKDDNSNG